MADKIPEASCICFPLIFLNNYLQHVLRLEAGILSVQKNFPTKPTRDLSELLFHILENTHNLRKSLGERISSFRQTSSLPRDKDVGKSSHPSSGPETHDSVSFLWAEGHLVYGNGMARAD